MARPTKATVDYFPHDTNTDDSKTVLVMQNKYGNDGFAFWFRLLEFLGKRDGLSFDFSDPADLELLCAKTHQKDTETVMSMLNELVTLKDIDLELFKHKIIWCQKFVERVADAFSRSVNGVPKRPNVSGTRKPLLPPQPDVSVTKTGESADILHTETPKNDTETPQKEKEIKVNESKEKTTTPTPPPLSLLSDKQVEVRVEKSAFTLYSEEIGKLSSFTSALVNDAINYYTESWVCDAIREAVLANARNKWNYATKVLENWKNEGRDIKPEEISPERDTSKYFKGKYGHAVFGAPAGIKTFDTIESIQEELKKRDANHGK